MGRSAPDLSRGRTETDFRRATAIPSSTQRQLVCVCRQRPHWDCAGAGRHGRRIRAGRLARPRRRAVRRAGGCPHLGADLSTGVLDGGALICPWHGLRLTGCDESGWRPYPSYDDGVFAWVRLDHFGGETRPRCRSLRGVPAHHGYTRLPGWSACASRATSSPTGSTRGTAAGFTRIRSPISKCWPRPRRAATSMRSPTVSWSR